MSLLPHQGKVFFATEETITETHKQSKFRVLALQYNPCTEASGIIEEEGAERFYEPYTQGVCCEKCQKLHPGSLTDMVA